MCCFSGMVRDVSGTQIFARPSDGDAQILVYSMKILAAQEVSMILPLPVPPRSPEDAVRFINLEAYPAFFTDLDSLFPAPMSFGMDDAPLTASASLAVHDVGQFEASFIPSLADFARLDPRFRLPATTWQDLPQYADWGFAVFKLKKPAVPTSNPSRGADQSFVQQLLGQAFMQATSEAPETSETHEAHRVHPMAFEFPRRSPSQLFFPTVHIHDGRVHPVASFDHQLYFQIDRMPAGMHFPGTEIRDILKDGASFYDRLEIAEAPLEQLMDIRRAAGTLRPAVPLYRWELMGEKPNQDSILNM